MATSLATSTTATTALVLAAESAAHGEGGVSPYLVGGTALGLLLLLLFVVVAVGGGREHT